MPMLPITTMFLGLAVCATSAVAQDEPVAPAAPPPATTTDPHALAVPIPRAELVERARAAREAGYTYLLKTQNADGSWGSHDPQIANLKDFGFQTGNRGSQDGVRLACTGIVATALLYAPDRTPEQTAAFERALGPLLDPAKFAYHRGEAFNVWGYGWKLDFLTRFLETPGGQERREAVVAAADTCIKGLLRFQQADGGWNYYAGPTMGGESMSFTTANFAQALHRAKRLGLDVPDGLAGDAAKLLKRMRTIKGGFVYDARFMTSAGSVNELSAGARTAACAVALHDMGAMDDPGLRRSLEIFNEGENYLEDGRKLIQPHTAVHQISGYFFFYGYYFAVDLVRRLGDAVPEGRWDRFAWTMVRTQEETGEWWDTAAADYGTKWGTGFAVQVLDRYLEHVAE